MWGLPGEGFAGVPGVIWENAKPTTHRPSHDAQGVSHCTELCPDIDPFQRDRSDPWVVVFSEIKRCQLPRSTQFFQKAKIGSISLSGLAFLCRRRLLEKGIVGGASLV